MSRTGHVNAPPSKPLLIFDGECNFCRRWIARWQHCTGDAVDYLPYQDPSIAERFPEISLARFEEAVQVIDTAGNVYGGAEAAFRSLAHAPSRRWLLWMYQNIPGVEGLTEWSYRRVARNRTVFSALTRWLWGSHVEPPTYCLTRDLFLRLLGVVYLCAFASLWVQILGLIGSNGISPAHELLIANESYNGFGAYWLMPTLCWFNSSDWFLKFLCGAGVALSLLPIMGLVSTPVMLLLWMFYLSLTSIGQPFLSFQWDALLLENGLLAIFFAPLRLVPCRSRGEPAPRLILCLLRWLLFRLMFESGIVKLTWNDPTWLNLTALTFHYETQPLPTWIGWFAHQLPVWFHKASCFLMYVIELGAPFLIFTPRRMRFVGCAALVFLQLLIALTGNYCFFNLLTIALCVTLLDDQAITSLVGAVFNRDRLARITAKSRMKFAPTRMSHRWPWWIITPLVAVILLVTPLQVLFSIRPRARLQRIIRKYYTFTYTTITPLSSVNSYGLFRVMTTSRPEIIIEGSHDGRTWLAYEFKFKPGSLSRRPGFVAPHQPRLDWQMWFAALSDYRHNQWFNNFCARLLQGKPDVLALLETNPFPDTPPRYIRAMRYDYHFTDGATRRAEGTWWRREFVGPYRPVMSLNAENKPPELEP